MNFLNRNISQYSTKIFEYLKTSLKSENENVFKVL